MRRKRKNPFEGVKKWHVFGVSIIAIAAVAVFGDKGFIDVYRLSKERDGILSYNSTVENENKDLERKISLLKTDKRYIEYVAKRELGMIGKDDVVYRLSPSQKAEKASSGK